MRILITGAYGFIGSHIASALHVAGHEVIVAVRRPDTRGRFAHWPAIACDFAHDTRVQDWLPRLRGVDAVVNGAGILRETRTQTFSAVHIEAPKALFGACACAGVRKIVQISALGNPEDGEFIRSKHAADAYLSTLDLDWLILRPSVTYSTAGSYGGTSLLRALAALPFVLFMPGDGRQRLQPIAVDDLARAVVRLVEPGIGTRRILEAVGPQPITFENYLCAFRRWLGFARPYIVKLPLSLIRPFAHLGEWLGRGPLGMTMYRMLQRDNVASPGAAEQFVKTVGFQPRSVDETLKAAPSHVQDRWHARLYLLAPVLRLTLALLWIGSGIAGFLNPAEMSTAQLAIAGIPVVAAMPLVILASSADIVFGVLALTRHVRLAAAFMLFMLVAYTLLLGSALPALWLEPFGSLLKNLPLIPAVLILLVLQDRR